MDLIDRDEVKRELNAQYAVAKNTANPDAVEQILREVSKFFDSFPAVNRWIPVENALPEIKKFNISDTVLCYCDSGTLAIARLEENGFGQVGFNCEKDDEYHHSAGKVLYWMPIPEIPDQPMEIENENR